MASEDDIPRTTAQLDELGRELEQAAPSATVLIEAASALVVLLEARRRLGVVVTGHADTVVFPEAAGLLFEIRRFAGFPAAGTPPAVAALNSYWAARAALAIEAAQALSRVDESTEPKDSGLAP